MLDLATLERDLRYNRLCVAAYMRPGAAARMCEELGYPSSLVLSDEASGAFALVCANNEETVLAVRGTERDYRDILADIRFRREDLVAADGRTYRVHRGFLSQWQGIADMARQALKTASVEGRRVVAAGHSLGGAVALNAAAALPWIVDEVVTFGAPRVGDAEFGRALVSRPHRRWVYAADIVPLVPLLAMGFEHDRPALYLTAGGGLVEDCPMWREIAGRARALLALRWKAGPSWAPVPARMWEDHRIDAYARGQSAVIVDRRRAREEWP